MAEGVKESIAVGSSTVRTVTDGYLVIKVDPNGRLEIIPFGPPVGTQDVNIIEVLGAAIAFGNPVIVGVFDAAGNRMPAMDVAARPGFIDIIDRAARLLGITDPSDRAARLLGVTFGSQAQAIQQRAATFETLVQLHQAGAEASAANPIPVEGTGLNTNPRRYEKDNGFRSPVVARAGGVATPLYTVATTPARTAGQDTTIYTLEIENSTGAAVTAWLEIGGVAITIPFHIADNDSQVLDYIAGLEIGDNDVDCNASVNGVNFSIKGTEA